MNSKTLASELKKLGIEKGDTVILHSSLRSLGTMEGGADGVIDAFLNVLGKSGTLLVPVFGSLGAVTDALKKRRGAVISSCPVSAVAALGARAKELCADHWKAETAHGDDTPYTRLASDEKGKICLLGVDQDRNTTLHSIEALLELPYLRTVSREFVTPQGKKVKAAWKFFPGPHRNFIGLDSVLLEKGCMNIGRIGNAMVRVIEAHRMFHTLLELGSGDPAFALCGNPACADCVRQRAAIAKVEFAGEDFKLAASSRLAGRYVPEMIENLAASGISCVELDLIQGRNAVNLPEDELKRAVSDFRAAGIEVTGIRIPAVPADPEGTAALLKAAGIGRAILPIWTSASAAEAFEKAGIATGFVNSAVTGRGAKALAAGLAEKLRHSGFVFNPAEFAKAGEHPFLGSYQSGRFLGILSQLDVCDCLWDGTPEKFAFGNCEIKELVSILRCHCFSGIFVLGGGAVCPGTLRETAAEFSAMLTQI